MKYLWVFWLPLLYLPNLSFANRTDFGTLSISDFFIGPFLIFVYLRGQSEWIKRNEKPTQLYVHFLIPTLLLFIWWAFLGTITINYRYDISFSYTFTMTFGLLKIAKLVLYTLTAILTIKVLSISSKKELDAFYISLLISSLIMTVGLLITGNSVENELTGNTEQLFQENSISVLISMFIVFFLGNLIRDSSNRLLKYATATSMIVIVLGFVLANGRGGWVAALVGLIYIGSRVSLMQTIRLTIIAGILILFAYNQYPSFRQQIDMTLQPSSSRRTTAIGIDDGNRSLILQRQSQLVFNQPVFGTGIFHRGGLSGTYSSGSHNFFLQMFLETGIPGGILVLVVVRQMWSHASTETAKRRQLDVPVKATLIAACVGALSESYFYGGMILFTLFILYGTVGALPITKKETLLSAAPSLEDPAHG